MLIKFNDSDPRAGTVAKMDSSRGEQLVKSGAAVLVKEGVETPNAEAASEAQVSVPAPAAKPAKAKK